MRWEGLAPLGVIRSRGARAGVVKVAASDALASPGVLGVWTAGDLPELIRPLVTAGAERRRPYSMPVLAGAVARYVGEPIGIAVADTAPHLARSEEHTSELQSQSNIV